MSRNSIAVKRNKLPRFFHIRNYVNGRLMEKGGETFYIQPHVEVGGKTFMVEVAHARCSTRDNFCRRIGREITVNRMRKGQQTYFMSWDEFLQGLAFNRQQRSKMKRRMFK